MSARAALPTVVPAPACTPRAGGQAGPSGADCAGERPALEVLADAVDVLCTNELVWGAGQPVVAQRLSRDIRAADCEPQPWLR